MERKGWSRDGLLSRMRAERESLLTTRGKFCRACSGGYVLVYRAVSVWNFAVSFRRSVGRPCWLAGLETGGTLVGFTVEYESEGQSSRYDTDPPHNERPLSTKSSTDGHFGSHGRKTSGKRRQGRGVHQVSIIKGRMGGVWISWAGPVGVTTTTTISDVQDSLDWVVLMHVCNHLGLFISF